MHSRFSEGGVWGIWTNLLKHRLPYTVCKCFVVLTAMENQYRSSQFDPRSQAFAAFVACSTNFAQNVLQATNTAVHRLRTSELIYRRRHDKKKRSCNVMQHCHRTKAALNGDLGQCGYVSVFYYRKFTLPICDICVHMHCNRSTVNINRMEVYTNITNG